MIYDSKESLIEETALTAFIKSRVTEIHVRVPHALGISLFIWCGHGHSRSSAFPSCRAGKFSEG